MTLVAQLAAGGAVIATILFGALFAESRRLDRQDNAEQQAEEEAQSAARG